jgi:hypothetical protein
VEEEMTEHVKGNRIINLIEKLSDDALAKEFLKEFDKSNTDSFDENYYKVLMYEIRNRWMYEQGYII